MEEIVIKNDLKLVELLLKYDKDALKALMSQPVY